MEQDNYYSILQVDPNCSMEEINASYQQLVQLYKGNKLALYSLLSQDQQQAEFSKIEQAYAIISHPVTRRQYDIAHNIKNNCTHSEQLPYTDPNKKIVLNYLALHYTADSAMEKRIEQCEEFTGPFLKEIREYKNVNILKMSRITKISQSYLNSIESEDFASLPAAVYVRGFIVQYVKFLRIPHIAVPSYINRLKKARKQC